MNQITQLCRARDAVNDLLGTCTLTNLSTEQINSLLEIKDKVTELLNQVQDQHTLIV